jgi:hypothetical protein
MPRNVTPLCSWHEEVLQIRGRHELLIVVDPKPVMVLEQDASTPKRKLIAFCTRHDDERAAPR